MSKIINKFLDVAPANTLKGNNTGSSANVTDLTTSQVNAMLGTLSNPMTTGGDIIYGGASGTPTRLANGSAGQVLTSNGGTSAPSWQPSSGSGAFQFFASSQVTTDSGVINTTAFTTFSNSPGFTFTPTVSGTYKVYASPNIFNGGSNSSVIRIFETSAVATLLYESQGRTTAVSGTAVESTSFIQSVYTLSSGTAYTFDIQGKLSTFPGDCEMIASASPFYMFAELCG